MEFPKTKKEEADIASNEGFGIYEELRKKYSNNIVIVLDSLCFALVRLGKLSTGKGDEKKFAELVKQIVLKNMVK